MLDPVDPVRVRICTDYAGEAIGTLLKVMRRDDASPDTRMRAAKEVLHPHLWRAAANGGESAPQQRLSTRA